MMRLLAQLCVVIAIVLGYRGHSNETCAMYLLTALVLAVLSLGDSWLGRTWREAYSDAKREKHERQIEL